MTTDRVSDRATSRALGVAGLLLVGVWCVAAETLVLLRIVLAHQPTPGGAAEASLLISAGLLTFALWLGAYAVLGVGLALTVAAGVVAGRARRAVTLAGLVGLFAAAGYVLESLRSATVWDLHPDRLATVVATTGTVVAPVAALVAVLALLVPVVRTPRSTPEPAAAG